MCLKDIGIEEYNFKTGELWTYCGYKKRDGPVPISLHQGFDVVELFTTLSLGENFKALYFDQLTDWHGHRNKQILQLWPTKNNL